MRIRKDMIEIYQFVNLDRLNVLRRILRSLPDNVTPAFDLEDGHIVIGNEELTKQMKEDARAKLILNFESSSTIGRQTNFALRINCMSSGASFKDFMVAKRMHEAGRLKCIMLPKVESLEHIEECRAHLDREKILGVTIVPIVETEAGLSNIKSIAYTSRRLGAEAIAFGYHDYWLQQGVWPFPLAYDDEYWGPVEVIVDAARTFGLRYVSPPEPRLRDSDLLRMIATRLNQLIPSRFEFFSAGPSQTKTLLELFKRSSEVHNEGPKPLTGQKLTLNEAVSFAKRIRSSYLIQRRDAASFASDPSLSYFISPHIYMAATRFLMSHDDYEH